MKKYTIKNLAHARAGIVTVSDGRWLKPNQILVFPNYTMANEGLIKTDELGIAFCTDSLTISEMCQIAITTLSQEQAQ